MPYVRFVRRGDVIDVYKRLPGGRRVKAFTSHSSSMARARKTAARRELEGMTRRDRRG